jgi:hypothetical protein
MGGTVSHALANVNRLGRAGLAAVLVVLGLLAATAPAASAETFRVDSEADLPDATPGSGGCAAAGGECTLRAAFEEANAQSSDDVVRLPEGHYELTAGQLPVAANGELTVRGDNRHGRSTVIDAASNSRVIEVEDDADLTLRGVTVTGGDAIGGGGGILTGIDSTTNLVQVRVNGNRTIGSGGGISNQGELIVRNSDVETNTADANGGGISTGEPTIGRLGGDGSEAPSLDLELSRVNNNDAEIGGGGIYVGFGPVDSYRSTVSGNTAAQYAGGILGSVVGTPPASPGEFDTTITLETSTVSSNETSGLIGDGSGGGILLFGGALLEAENTTIAANINSLGGTTGAGLSLDGGSASLRNTIVADNRSNGEMDNCRITGGTIESLGFNLENEDECTLDQGTDLPNENPQLGRLRLNRSGPDGPKGRGETHKIAPGSPAHNAGPANCGPVDQRGLGRPVGPRCDIGAYERKD